MQKILLAGLIALTPMIALADTGTGTQTPPPPRPPMGSGTQDGQDGQDRQSQGLGMAISQLSPTDRATLDKMIRDYLTSKGIDPAKFAEKREEIRAIREETRDAVQEVKKEGQSAVREVRKENQQVIKTKRMEMRGKIRDIRQDGGSGSVR